jgi:hypothetical protein
MAGIELKRLLIDRANETLSLTSLPSLSVSERLFLLQISRKETADASLDASMTAMQAKLEDQQKLNTILSDLSLREPDQQGNVFMTEEETSFLARVGFNVDEQGKFKAPVWRGEDNLQSGAAARTYGKDGPNRGKVFIPKDQLATFKEGLSKHITALSGSNEIQMLQVQRLMNAANEAMQSASSQLKANHDIAMAIIRNIA